MFPEVPRFQANKLPNILKISGFNVVVPICYESLFLDYFSSFQQPIEMIISISNDAWFESDLQKKWHSIIALARSVELQVPVVRVTNNGASGISQASGKFEFYKFGIEDAFVFKPDVSKKVEASFMQKHGEFVQQIPRVLAYLILLSLLVIVFKRKDN
jgi:apolipoprotein N-acyltransferase